MRRKKLQRKGKEIVEKETEKENKEQGQAKGALQQIVEAISVAGDTDRAAILVENIRRIRKEEKRPEIRSRKLEDNPSTKK